MRPLAVLSALAIASGFAVNGLNAAAMDGTHCLSTAELVDDGEVLSAEEVEDAHQACVRALAATGSVLQKHQFQEADFTITGKYHQY